MPSNQLPSQIQKDYDRIRAVGIQKFEKRLCQGQLEIVHALWKGKDVVGCLKTGGGKTLTFWMPLLLALEEGKAKPVSFIVTPLNILGKQNVEQLERAGIAAVSVTAENNNARTMKDIEEGKYHAICISPEILMGSPLVEALWKKPQFTKRIVNFIFDEAHCVSQWGSFRKEYKNVGALRYLIPEDIPFYAASATLPPPVLADVMSILRFRAESTVKVIRSNDRPEIKIVVRGLAGPACGFTDLAFLIPKDLRDWKESDPIPKAPPKFLVFFDNTKEAERACRYLRSLIPQGLRTKVKWFHSTMTSAFREGHVDKMKDSSIWGLCCTDAFGMGVDIPDIEIVVQWRATCGLSTLWQRFGRVARGHGKTGVAILLVEKKDTHEGREAAAAAKRKRSAQGATPVGDEPAGKFRKTGEKGTRTKTGPPTPPAPASTTGVQDNPAQDEVPSAPPRASSEGNGIVDEGGRGRSFIAERRRHYAHIDKPVRGIGKKKPKKADMVEVGNALDDFINSVANGYKCRRMVITVFFGNDETSQVEHQTCDPSTPSGCDRCVFSTPEVCCDLCNSDSPALLLFQVQPDVSSTASKTIAKSSIKAYDLSDEDLALAAAIRKWRDVNAPKKFQPTTLRCLGTKLLLPDSTVDRIVGCVHYKKINTAVELKAETGWLWADELGASLLEIVKPFVPKPVVKLPSKRNGPVQCSECKQFGHRKSNRDCPKKVQARGFQAPVAPSKKAPKPSKASRGDGKENQLPQAPLPKPAAMPKPRPVPRKCSKVGQSPPIASGSCPTPLAPAVTPRDPNSATPIRSVQPPSTPRNPYLAIYGPSAMFSPFQTPSAFPSTPGQSFNSPGFHRPIPLQPSLPVCSNGPQGSPTLPRHPHPLVPRPPLAPSLP